jgi:hypothetical protein
MGRESFFGAYDHANLAVFALVALTLDALASGLVVFDTAAFERYCRTIDGSGAAATVQLLVCFGPAVLLLIEDIRQGVRRADISPPQRRWVLALDGLAVVYLLWYVLALRGPWLAEQTSAQGRLTLWSARLSATVGGVPLIAFLHTVGFGVLFAATSSASLRTFAAVGYLRTPQLLLRASTAVRVLCTLDFVLVTVSFVTFATGGVF